MTGALFRGPVSILSAILAAMQILSRRRIAPSPESFRLTPWLERGWLQGIGFGFYLAAVIGMAVTGRYLAGNYEQTRRAGGLLMDRPYAAMRHPIYSALIATRIGFALLFASVQRIRREEASLRLRFGDRYDAYARRTPALFHASLLSLFRR